jgi:CHAT domain-containing protein/tetratricopeptide (TPR) repeat protein
MADSADSSPLARSLAQALGPGVLCGEDLKGQLRQAAELADKALDQAAAASPEAVEAALARAGIAVLAGDTGLALRLCQRFQAEAAGDARRHLQRATLAHLATIGHYNTLPDHAAAGTDELSARWPGTAYLQQELPQWQACLQAVDDDTQRNAAKLLHETVAGLPTLRYLALSGRYTPAPPGQRDTLAAMLTQAADRLLGLQQAVPSQACLGLAAADLAWRAGDSPTARTRLETIEGLCDQAGDVAGLALCAMTRGDWHAAPASSPLAMNLLLMEGSSEGSDLAWTCEAVEGSRDGLDVAAAQIHYERARALFLQQSMPRGLAALRLRAAWLAAVQQQANVAVDRAEAAASEFASCGDSANHHLSRMHAALYRVATAERLEDASACTAAGHWGASDGSFSQALGMGLLCNRVARDWLLRRGDAERALAVYRLAEALFAALGARSNQAQSLIDQGRCAKTVGEQRMALTLFEQALDLMAATSREPSLLAAALRPRLSIRSMMLSTSTYQLHQARRDADGMERSAARLAALRPDTLPPSMEDLLTGRADFEHAVLGEMSRDVVVQASVLVPLYRATDAREAGQADTAATLFAQALAAAGSAGNQRNFLEATVFAQQRQVAPAIAAFERYLAQSGADSGLSGQLTAMMRAHGGTQGEVEARRQRQRSAEQRLGFMVVNRAWPQARQALDALRSEAGRDWWQSSYHPWEDLRLVAEIEEAEGHYDAALASYSQAIDLLEARRSALRRDDLKLAIAGERGAQDLYFMASRAALRAGRLESAFDYMQGGRARALLDLMAGVHAAEAARNVAADDLVGQWQQAQAELALQRGLLAQARTVNAPEPARVAGLTERVEVGEARLNQIEQSLARSHPGVAELLGRGARRPTLAECCSALPTDALLLEWAFLGDDLLAWALTRDGMVTHRVQAVDALVFSRQLWMFATACAHRRDVDTLDRPITEVLLAPFADWLRRYRRVVLVPYGAAHRLPFAALSFDGQPLGLTHALSVLPSTSLLGQLALDQPLAAGASTPMLAVGNPEGDLPGAEVEAAAVAGLYGQRALLRDQATSAALLARLPGTRVLHLALHGQLDEAAPLASALRLAGGDQLSVHRLLGLHLSADLVVLSACDSGRGETTGGDDVVGLTRGLLAAGARAAVVSLWPVDDLSTAVFMHRFHLGLMAGLVPAEALRQAAVTLQSLDAAGRECCFADLVTKVAISTQTAPSGQAAMASVQRRIGQGRQAVVDDPRHPYYWAAFVLVG